MKNRVFEYLNSNFGKRAQVIKAIEELSELQIELSRWLNADIKDGSHEEDNRDNILEEIADVKIVTDFLCKIFMFDDDQVEFMVNTKLNRVFLKIHTKV